jgi:hypothetical protein
MFFRKHRDFPLVFFFIGLLFFYIIFTEEFITIMLGEIVYFRETLAVGVWVILWSLYLFNSARVSATFTYSRAKLIKISEEEYLELLQKVRRET